MKQKKLTPPDLNISLDELDIPDVKSKSNQYPIYTNEEMAIAYDLYEHVVFKVGEDDCMTDEDLPIEEHTTDEELWFSEYYQDLEDQGVGKLIK